MKLVSTCFKAISSATAVAALTLAFNAPAHAEYRTFSCSWWACPIITTYYNRSETQRIAAGSLWLWWVPVIGGASIAYTSNIYISGACIKVISIPQPYVLSYTGGYCS